MENRAEVRAYFAGCNIKPGKTVMQFELDPEYKGALPQLSIMAGTHVMIDLASDQLVIPVDANSGEVLEGQEQAFEEDFDEEEADEVPSAYELPAPVIEYEDEQDEAA